ncbi:MAG TPA: hypothetical protein VFS39_02965 [Nitrospira sp.]|nr:hypothetical protein [Nitrospira sp.]
MGRFCLGLCEDHGVGSERGRLLQDPALQASEAERTVPDPQLREVEMGFSRGAIHDQDLVGGSFRWERLARQANGIHVRAAAEDTQEPGDRERRGDALRETPCDHAMGNVTPRIVADQPMPGQADSLLNASSAATL